MTEALHDHVCSLNMPYENSSVKVECICQRLGSNVINLKGLLCLSKREKNYAVIIAAETLDQMLQSESSITQE